MSKRLPEHDSSQNISSSKLSRGCIILSDDRIKLPEVISHLDSNFEDLISRGEHSKILILDGTHGSKDGGDSLTEKTFYEPSFMEETCEALGTRHHLHRRRLPRYEKIKPYPEQCLRDWKRRGEFHDGINTIQALRKKLYQNNVSVEIANIGYFYRDPDSLVRFIKTCDPSAIILNWCRSEKTKSRWLLQRVGLLARVFLNNERVLLTGNKTIRLDENQEALINEMETKLKQLRDVPGSPRPHVFILGPAGETVSLNCIIHLSQSRFWQDIDGH